MEIAIAGYGNLGKSLEKIVNAAPETHLAAVFSRREINHPLRVAFEEAHRFAGKIDVVMLALGSFDDLERNAKCFAAFDTVDSFDTHAKIEKYKAHLNEVKPNTLSLCCVGWDPGVLSIVRGALALGGGEIATFWGRGISQGHSNALRQIAGVRDAVEITVPKEETLTRAHDGAHTDENARHCRLCFVSCDKGEENRIAQEIVNMPNYFCGQEVKIEFCSNDKVAELKRVTEHSGEVVVCGEGFTADAKLHVDSNTDYTARVMLAYAKAVPYLKRDGFVGAYDPFEVPLKYVAAHGLV